MPRRRLVRFLLELAFLAGLAALATVARMRPGAIVAVMVFGWVVVALAEWSSWLDRPHFGRGLPPRFYVPQVSLPAPEPIEQLAIRLPSGGRRVEDEETWIASSTSWSAAFDDWPVLDLDRLGEDTVIARPDAPGDDTGVGTVFAPLAEPAAETPGAPATPADLSTPLEQAALPAALEPVSQPVLEPAPERALEPVPERALLPDPVRETVHQTVAETVHQTVPEPVLEAIPVPLPEPEGAPLPGRRRQRQPLPSAAPPLVARHRIDPFAPSGRARRWRRRREGSGVVEVPDRPALERPLPTAVIPGRGVRPS